MKFTSKNAKAIAAKLNEFNEKVFQEDDKSGDFQIKAEGN